MDHYVNVCLNLDKRDSNGKPTVTKTPEDYIKFSLYDLVILTISIIENGVEKEVKTVKLWNDVARPDITASENQTEKMIV